MVVVLHNGDHSIVGGCDVYHEGRDEPGECDGDALEPHGPVPYAIVSIVKYYRSNVPCLDCMCIPGATGVKLDMSEYFNVVWGDGWWLKSNYPYTRMYMEMLELRWEAQIRLKVMRAC